MFPNDGQTDDGASAYVLDFDMVTPAPTTDPMKRTYTVAETLRVFPTLDLCKDAMNAMSDDGAYHRFKSAALSDQYHDFKSGERVHIASEPDPNDIWVVIANDSGNEGCISRYRLPEY